MSQWPHDDTASLTAFYGPPATSSNMVLVVPPWPITYEGRPCRGVQIHRKCAASLKAVFDDIALQVGHDWSKLPPGATVFSGSYNPRPIRGSSRPSCHSFGAAVDWDSEQNTMNYNGDKGSMSPIVVGAYKRQGWYWGGDFHSRQDPMHFQAANETSRVAEIASDLNPVSTAQAADTPPLADDTNLAEEAVKPQAMIEELPHTESDYIPQPQAIAPTTTPAKIITARTAAGTGAAVLGAGQIAQSVVGPAHDIATQVSTVTDNAGQVIDITKKVVSVPKPGVGFGLLHIITSPSFILGVVVLIAVAWGLVWLWQKQHRQ